MQDQHLRTFYVASDLIKHFKKEEICFSNVFQDLDMQGYLEHMEYFHIDYQWLIMNGISDHEFYENFLDRTSEWLKKNSITHIRAPMDFVVYFYDTLNNQREKWGIPEKRNRPVVCGTFFTQGAPGCDLTCLTAKIGQEHRELRKRFGRYYRFPEGREVKCNVPWYRLE